MKILLIITSLVLSAAASRAQSTPHSVYYLADTASASPSNSILSIGREAQFKGYLFYCRCIKNNEYVYPAFVYDVTKAKTETFSELPKYKYLSWKQLEDMLYQQQQGFDKFYSLEVVEKMPDGTYEKNKVRLTVIKTVSTQ